MFLLICFSWALSDARVIRAPVGGQSPFDPAINSLKSMARTAGFGCIAMRWSGENREIRRIWGCLK
jgi:hypothetical protein